MTMTNQRLQWMRKDIERRFGFPGARYTRVGGLLPALLAIFMTIVIFESMVAIGSNPWTDMFLHRGWTPAVITFFGLWSVMILWIKRSKLRLQREALLREIVPSDPAFTLSIASVDSVLDRLNDVADDPRFFVLFDRIEVGLSSIRNLGRPVDLGEILRTQADRDESIMETSFNLIRGLVWAIPILGFIGTVSGLSTAIGGFGRVLSQTEDPSELIGALKGVTGGLATAFETTLLALVAALLVQMMMTFQKKREEEFLDECTEYCQREVLSRLRTPSVPGSPVSGSPVSGTPVSGKPVSGKPVSESNATGPGESRGRIPGGIPTAGVVAVEPTAVESITVQPSTVDSIAVEPIEVDSFAVEPIEVEPIGVEPIGVEPIEIEALDAIPVELDDAEDPPGRKTE